MTTHAQGSPAPKPGRPHFIQITHDQLALPKTRRGETHDGNRVSQLQWLVLCGLERLSWGGKRKCRAKDLEIADAIGLTGRDRARRNQVQIALHGRTYRKWNPETGKRDGELVRAPGLCDPPLGFVEALHGPAGERELALTPKWLQWNRFRVFQGGNGGSREGGPGDAQGVIREAAGVSTVPPGGDGSTAPADPPPPESSEATETGTATAVAVGTNVARDGETAPATAGRPSPETLNEVLGRHASAGRASQAEWLVGRLGQRGVRFGLCGDGKVRPLPNPGAEPPTETETAILRWLKPEIVALLEAEAVKAKASPKAGGTSDVAGPTPRVACRADVRARIKRLAACPAPDDSECRAIARLLAADPGFSHNDVDPARSEALYLGLARQTKDGMLPEAVFLGAFEEACKPRKVNRGAALVDSVKRLKSALRKPDHEGGRTS